MCGNKKEKDTISTLYEPKFQYLNNACVVEGVKRARDSFYGMAIFVLNSMYLINSWNCLYQLWQGGCDSSVIFFAFMYVSLSCSICFANNNNEKTHNAYELWGKKGKDCCFIFALASLHRVVFFTLFSLIVLKVVWLGFIHLFFTTVV